MSLGSRVNRKHPSLSNGAWKRGQSSKELVQDLLAPIFLTGYLSRKNDVNVDHPMGHKKGRSKLATADELDTWRSKHFRYKFSST